MKKLVIALCATLPALALGGCTGGGIYSAGSYGPGPYAYDGYYDNYYGPIYDGYWGGDGVFYYRNGGGDRHYRRGDPTHFAHGGDRPSEHFQEMHGNMTPQAHMHMPHFNPGGGGGHGGGDHGGHGHH